MCTCIFIIYIYIYIGYAYSAPTSWLILHICRILVARRLVSENCNCNLLFSPTNHRNLPTYFNLPKCLAVSWKRKFPISHTSIPIDFAGR